jgi:hypothetical protein
MFLTVYPCFASKKYTGTSKFPFRALIRYPDHVLVCVFFFAFVFFIYFIECNLKSYIIIFRSSEIHFKNV